MFSPNRTTTCLIGVAVGTSRAASLWPLQVTCTEPVAAQPAVVSPSETVTDRVAVPVVWHWKEGLAVPAPVSLPLPLAVQLNARAEGPLSASGAAGVSGRL